jgi:hypothetical protein
MTDRQKVRLYLENMGLNTQAKQANFLGISVGAVRKQLSPSAEGKVLAPWCRAIINTYEYCEGHTISS